MDARAISAIFLKVAGLLLIAWSVVQLPGYFPPRLSGADWSAWDAVIGSALTLGPALILGAALWFFPGTITNKVVVTGGSSPQGVDASTIVLIAAAIVGLYLMAHGTVDLVYHIVTVVRLERTNPGIAIVPPTIYAAAVASIVEMALGVAFILGRRGIAQLVTRMRG